MIIKASLLVASLLGHALGPLAPLAVTAEQDEWPPKPRTDVDQAEIDKHPLSSAQNPVRCDMPPGQLAYLGRLRCPSGWRPSFSRSGSAGAGPYGTIIDVYAVECPEEDHMGEVSVFMDMYHRGYVETRPVPGFTIRPVVEVWE